MALVMLPCDLPWWSVVQKKLKSIQESDDFDVILEVMQKLHDLCNVSLDPDEDSRDSNQFNGLKDFLENDMDLTERTNFIDFTLKNIARRAQNLRCYRPPNGLSFSLQQQSDSVEMDYKLVSSLLANAFFSTFPKRTAKTHPTLQDFNFTYFFSALETKSQKAKLRSFLYYFDWLELKGNDEGCIKISRKVMTGKQWLTIDDWLECCLPICSLEIKHEGRLERAAADSAQTIFSSQRIGGSVLRNGNSQECIQLSTFPELLVILLHVESLEDNEAITIQGARQISRIIDPKNKSFFEKLEKPRVIPICCMDAENYFEFPINQFEEDNVLRELNKCLLTFRQNSTCAILESLDRSNNLPKLELRSNSRLSPIGESESTNSPDDVSMKIIIKQASTSTKKSSYDSGRIEDMARRRSWLSPSPTPSGLVSGPTASGRRGRFIVLGSSGEHLPVNRKYKLSETSTSQFSSCNSSLEEFHSAKGSIDEESDEDEGYARKYSLELDTPEGRGKFAKKLRDALQSESLSDSTDDSYAVGISIGGSQTGDGDIKIKRCGGSRGFVVTEDSFDDEFYKEAIVFEEREWINKLRHKRNGTVPLKDTNDSSKYSFSTEYSSELEEVYEQFSKWMEDPIIGDKTRELDPRDEAVLSFANSLLKRTLSESFVGVPLTDGCCSSTGAAAENTSIQNYQNRKEKPILNPRSLSLELAKHKHRLAAQLNRKFPQTQHEHNRSSLKTTPKQLKWSISEVQRDQTINCDDVVIKKTVRFQDKISQIGQRRIGNSDLYPIATGNWGCGSSSRGDVQLKLVIQWMAASVAGLPVLIYYTAGHEKLTKLDTICRVLLDRKWTVGELAAATLLHAKDILDDPFDQEQCFFEKLIGLER